MATDYLEDIIGAVKQGAAESTKATEEAQKKSPAEEKVIMDDKQKPEDKEEELAREIKQKDVKGIEKEEVDNTALDKTAIEKELEANQKTEVKSYGKVKIYRIPGRPLAYYFVPTTKPTSSERRMINTLKEATTRLLSIAPYKIRNPEERRIIYKQKVVEIIRNNPNLKIPQSRQNFYADAVVREMVGYGLIDDLIKDDNLEEIMIVGPKRPVYVFHREYEMMLTNIEFYSEQEIEDLINKIAREVGRRVDVSSPLLDARLNDGSRVNATIPPASISGGTITIRKFRTDPYSLIDLIKMNTMSSEAAAFLWMAVDGLGVKPANILISGGTGSGKTTLLNVLAAFVPDRERVITIEDTAELNLPIKHWIRLESRPPGLEGSGELKMDILTKNSLRMRPDRIIVGEIRHEEAFTLFTALNTGHDGMASADTLIQLTDGTLRKLGEFCEEYIQTNPVTTIKDIQKVQITDSPKIMAINKQSLLQEQTKVKTVWKRECKERYDIKTSSGKEIKLSFDHPIFRIKKGFVEQVMASQCKEGDYICTINSLNIKGTTFDENSAYFIGLLLGDGHLRKGRITFENKNKKLHKIYSELTQTVFQKTPHIRKRDDGRMTAVINSVKLSNDIHEKFNIPFGNKTKIFDIPKEIETANNKCVGLFLRGMFDTDGHASNIRNSVCLATTNKNVAKKVPLLLERFGIKSRLNIQNKDGRGNNGPYYRIFITAESNLRKFHDFVGFGHPKKDKRLKKALGLKENTNTDVMPGSEEIISKIRKGIGLSQKELSVKAGFGKTGTVINSYEVKARTPSRNALKKINVVFTSEFNKKIKKLETLNIETELEEILHSKNPLANLTKYTKNFCTMEELQKNAKLANKLIYYYLKKPYKINKEIKENIIESTKNAHAQKMLEMSKIKQLILHINSISSKNIFWDKISKIEKKEEKAPYYDLTLDNYNTFVANGLVISNCMGTVHANSPQETLIRVMSPPMNVPSIMMTGLDLIIVEHRYYDRKKGTIRRISEIAEVYGAMEGLPKTQTIFQRDSVRDELEKTLVDSKYLKMLQTFTGITKDRLNAELDARKKFLENMVEKNIRDLNNVSESAKKYIEDKNAMMV